MSYFPNNTLSATPTDWRQLLTAEERKVNVGRLFKGLELLNQPNVEATQRFQLSKQWENEAFNIANTRDEYNAKIGAKLREITNMIQNGGAHAKIRVSQPTAQQQQAVQQQQQVSQQQQQQQVLQQQQQVLQQQQQPQQQQTIPSPQQQQYQRILQQQRMLFQQPLSPQQQQQQQQQQLIQLLSQQQIPLTQQQPIRQQQINNMLQSNPGLLQKIQEQQLRKLQLQRQQQPQLQMQPNPQQIAVAQANGFIRPNAQQIQSSPKPTQQGTFRPNVLSSYLSLPPDTPMTEDLAKKVAYLSSQRARQQVQQPNLQDMSSSAVSAESQLNRIKVSQQAAANAKLSPSQIIQPSKGQVAPPQNPGPSVLIMNPMTNNQSPVNLPNKLIQNQTKVPTHIKMSQNGQNRQLTSPAVQHVNINKNSTSVGISPIQDSSSIPSVQSTNVGNQAGRPVMIPNNVTAAMMGITAPTNNASILNPNVLLLNNPRPGVMIPPNISFRPTGSVIRPGDVTMSNGGSSASGQYATLSQKEETEALSMIREIDRRAQERRIQYHEIHDLTNEEKAKILEKLHELEPMYKNVDKVLPYFWHYTRSSQGTFRLLGMKYMIEDQFNALPGKFLLRLELVDNLLQQFRKYFDFVDNRRRGIEDSTMMNLNLPTRPTMQQLIPPNAENIIRPRINPSDLKLPNQRIHNDTNSSAVGKKRRQSSTEQETQQLSKKQTTNNNNVQSKSTPDVMIIDPPNTALPKTSALSPDNRKSHGTIISDDKPTIGHETHQEHKTDATSEEIRRKAQTLMSTAKCIIEKNKETIMRGIRSGPSLAERAMIGGLPSEENEYNILFSLVNTA